MHRSEGQAQPLSPSGVWVQFSCLCMQACLGAGHFAVVADGGTNFSVETFLFDFVSPLFFSLLFLFFPLQFFFVLTIFQPLGRARQSGPDFFWVSNNRTGYDICIVFQEAVITTPLPQNLTWN